MGVHEVDVGVVHCEGAGIWHPRREHERGASGLRDGDPGTRGGRAIGGRVAPVVSFWSLMRDLYEPTRRAARVMPHVPTPWPRP